MTTIVCWNGEARPFAIESINSDDLYFYDAKKDEVVRTVGCKQRGYTELKRMTFSDQGHLILTGMALRFHLAHKERSTSCEDA